MRINTYEWVGIGVVLGLFVLTLITTQMDSNLNRLFGLGPSQTAAVGASYTNDSQVQGSSYTTNSNLIINEIERGSGAAVVDGDTVTVHYVGTLASGEQFDSSKDRGEPFTFTVGAGRVIAGWEEGIIGMREGGTRVLVIPPDMAYGTRSVGQIPANATLVFAIELLSIK